MSEFSAECQAANRIAASLRGLPVPRRARGKPQKTLPVRRPGRPKGLSMVPTAAQLRVLAFMREFFERNDQLPPYTAMARHFGWKTHSCAQSFIVRLAHKGLIERNEVGNWRFPRETQQ